MADVIVYAILLFGVALIILFGASIMPTFQANDYVNHNYTTNGTTINPYVFMAHNFLMLDWVYLVMAALFTLGLFITGFLIPSHPVFAVVSIIIAIVWMFVAPWISNIFFSVLQIYPINQVANAFPFITTWVLNMPLITLVIGFIAGILTYGKNPGVAQA